LRKKTLAVLTAAAVVATTLTVPAATAQESRPVVALAPPDGCEQSMKDAPAKAGARYDICSRVEDVTLTPAQVAKVNEAARTRKAQQAAKAAPSPKRGGATKMGTQDVIDGCVGAGGPEWHMDRFSACRKGKRRIVDVIQKRPRVIIGRITMIEALLSFTNDEPGIWNLGLIMVPESRTGAYDGVRMEGNFVCSGFCGIVESNFPPTPVDTNQTQSVWGYAESGVGPGQAGFGHIEVTFKFTHVDDRTEPTPNTVLNGQDVRCDDMIGNRDRGCVIHTVWPVFGIPSWLYGVVSAHVQMAQESGIPGEAFPLHRITDQSRINKNRRTSCGNAPTIPDLQCDEYPFASTREGAANRPTLGRTVFFPSWDCQMPHLRERAGAGWSACMVPAWENRDAGIDLGVFYADFRVIDGDPFFVEID